MPRTIIGDDERLALEWLVNVVDKKCLCLLCRNQIMLNGPPSHRPAIFGSAIIPDGETNVAVINTMCEPCAAHFKDFPAMATRLAEATELAINTNGRSIGPVVASTALTQ